MRDSRSRMHGKTMPYSDIRLAKRLERAEGRACIEFVEARRRLFPESGAEWIECGGAYAAFDGANSPITQTFGLGLFEELSPAILDEIERFFMDRGAPVVHEVSPVAGVAALDLLCARNYRPVEISNVLYQAIEKPAHKPSGPIRVRVVQPGELQLWTDISSRGWTSDHPELLEFFQQFGRLSSTRQSSVYFLADFEGKPGAAAVLCPHEGTALLGGAATIPELRHRGLQSALLRGRLCYAHEHGCDLASMVAEVGSESQRNAERNGFQIAYTRIKWQLSGVP
jgi:GNAT superfamily N-acetyltransferase